MNNLAFPRKDRVLFLLKDPHWTFIWWDLVPETLTRARVSLGVEGIQARLTLRVYDLTGMSLDTGTSHHFLDVDVFGPTDHWYLNIWEADRRYCVEVGLKTPAGDFHALARSNTLDLPRDKPSDCMDEVWSTMQFDGMED